MKENTLENKILGMEPEYGRWALVAFGSVIFFFIGTIYSWSIFRGPIQKLYGATATESGAPYMLFFAIQAFSMPFLGPFIDKIHPRRVILLNGAIMSAGLILSSFAENIYQFTAAFSFIFGFGATAVYATPIAVATKWFPDRKGLAIGLTLFGMGLAPLVMAPLAVKFVAKWGVLMTFRILGAAFLVIAVTLSLPIKYPPPGWTPKGWVPKENSHSTPNTLEFTRGEMIKTPAFFALWICFMISSGIGLTVIGMTNQAAVEIIKMSPESAAFAISIFAIFNGLGRPAWGYIVDRLRPRLAITISFTMTFLASLAMAFARENSIAVFAVAIPTIWFCYGGWLSIAPSVTANFFGLKNSSQNYGIVFTGFGIAAVVGNTISGKIKDIYGDYIYVFYIIPFAAAAGIIIANLFLKQPNKKAQ